ncbi:unnamed protein product [Pipistrellus nathusii]|uniref:G-protein coupled receptors family 1 profile domain-containing protein n=1 Tax=Pipistrellus nathusii TaxID=59473 RepID=A0ABP0AHH9_PIPNA
MTATAWGTELTPTNGSDQALSKCNKATLTPTVLVFTVALVGLAGNAVVLWLLGFRMRRNAFSIYILNLAGADFLFLSCQVTYSLQTFTNNFRSTCISIPYIFITVSIFAYISGLSFLSAISMERCLSVLRPIWYRCRRPRHWSAGMCALLWALSLLLSMLEGNYCGFLVRKRDPTWCRAFDFIIAAWLTLLFVLLAGSSLALLARLLCGSHRVPLTRLYVVILLIVLVVFIFSLPFSFKWFLCHWTPCSKTFSYFLRKTWVILPSLNSSVNPIIYFFVGSFRQRRQTLKLVLQRALEDDTDAKKSSGSLPQETREISGSIFTQ